MIFVSTAVVAVSAWWLAAIFRRGLGDPLIRALFVFSVIVALVYTGVLFSEGGLGWAVEQGAYAQWRPVVFRGAHAIAFSYLVWAMRRRGRR